MMKRWLSVLFIIVFFILVQGKDMDTVRKIRDMSLEELMNVTVVSASRQEESLLETTVPVTVITVKMIENSQAQTIKELLLEYVPGFTHIQDQNEVNIAMRGVYTSSQQKILFMIDGVRLNSRSYSMASPSYSIALNQIQRIEVLRGPASSLYGNVALTAAINIILKKGGDIQGGQAKLAFGNFGKKSVALVFGDQKDQVEWMVWGQYFESDGQTIWIKPEDNYSPKPNADTLPAIIDGYKDRPSVNIGARIETQWGKVLFNYYQTHYIEPFSGGGLTGEAYDYGSYSPYEGIGPGLLTSGWMTEYSNTWQVKENWELFLSAFSGENAIKGEIVINPHRGTVGAPIWQEETIGGLFYGKLNYSAGNLVVGAQYDGFTVTSSKFPFGQNGHLGDDISTPENPLLYPGSEDITSVFFQLKHHVNSAIVANVGLRYDHKQRKHDQNIDKFSPRVGMSYAKSPGFNLKLSYASSFVDAPYWYRFNTLNSFRGAQDLKPEFLESMQMTPQWFFPEKNLKYALNLFYNRLSDFIFRDNAAPITETNYSNAGELSSWGIEQEFTWDIARATFIGIATYQKAISSERFGVTDDYIHNIPQFTASMSVDCEIIATLKLHTQVRYVGSQKSPINIRANGDTVPDPFPDSGVDFFDPDHEVDAVTLVNTSINWAPIQLDGLTLHVKVDNLFDENYTQGGSTLFPYPQAGRSWIMNIRWLWGK